MVPHPRKKGLRLRRSPPRPCHEVQQDLGHAGEGDAVVGLGPFERHGVERVHEENIASGLRRAQPQRLGGGVGVVDVEGCQARLRNGRQAIPGKRSGDGVPDARVAQPGEQRPCTPRFKPRRQGVWRRRNRNPWPIGGPRPPSPPKQCVPAGSPW